MYWAVSCRKQTDELGRKHDKEVHCEAGPDDKTRLLVTPDLDNTVIEFVQDRENDNSSRQRDGSEYEKFGFKKIRGDETYIEKYGHQEETDREGNSPSLWRIIHNTLFFKWLPSTLPKSDQNDGPVGDISGRKYS